MSHKQQEILFATNEGLVAISGGSTKLAQGVFGIVDKGGDNTKDGIPIVNTFSTTPKDRMFELRLGTKEGNATFGRSNKGYHSRPFMLSEIADISVHAPSLKTSVDEFWIGYDGVNEDTAIVLENGETAAFDITLSGQGIGFLGYPEGTITTKFYITAPSEGDVNMAELIEDAVKRYNKTTLVGGVPVSNYVEVTPINSTNTAPTGTTYTLYTLNVPMDGTNANVAQVLAQYPDLDIKVDGTIGGQTTFVTAITGEDAPEAFDVVTTTITLDCDEYESSADTVTTIAWVAGEECTAVEKEFTLQLADDNCGENRLADLEAYYPELEITAGESVNCQTVYTTSVLSDFVCEECSPAIRGLYETEAPEPFNFVHWVEEAPAYDPTALMGIRVKGKETVFAGEEYLRGSVPFLYDFVRINVAGGYPMTLAENLITREEPFSVKLISVGSRPESLGLDFYDFEDRTRVYFTGEQSDPSNLYRQRVLGMESMIKPLAQYVNYVIEIRPERFAQSFSSMKKEPIRYSIIAEVGKHKQLETLVNALATAAGLPTVQAYGGA